MSAFVGLLSDDYIMILTDTLLYREIINTELVGVKPSIMFTGFSQKANWYAQYRCCAICFGYQKTSIYLNEFIETLRNCFTIEQLILAIESDFFNYIDLNSYERTAGYDRIIPGCIQLFAYSEKENKLVWYIVNIGWNGLKVTKKDFLSGTVVTVPSIYDKAKEAAICSNTDLAIKDALIELMKLQQAESLNEDTSSVAIRGEIMSTIIAIKPQFNVSFEFVHKFGNFDETLANICQNSIITSPNYNGLNSF